MKVLISGLQGAGRGVYTVLRMIDILQTTEMHIITNFAIELNPWLRKMSRRRSRGEKGFLAHLRDTFGETFDAEKRIHVIAQSEVSRFYLWRINPEGELFQVAPILDAKTGRVIAFDEKAFSISLPVHYILDEAGQTFPARNWQAVEAGVAFYDAQHRKAGDNVDLTVQHSGQIDKQMRMLIQEYHSLVNHGYRKMGIFQQPNRISVFISNEPPESRSKSLGGVPKIIKFDKVGIGGSFDTAKGVGVQGMGADIERKRKGLPFWGLPLIVLLGGAGIIFAARGAGWFAGKQLTGGVLRQQERTKAEVGPIAKKAHVGMAVSEGSQVNTVQKRMSVPGIVPSTQLDDSLAITGWVKLGKEERILLNDGSTVVVPSVRCMTADHDMGVALIDRRVVTWEKKNKSHEVPTQQIRPMRNL